MRTLDVAEIAKAVETLYTDANYRLSSDLVRAIRTGKEAERSPVGREIFGKMLDNLDAAEESRMPICQDTGMAVVFLEVGQDVHLTGGLAEDAVNEGVANACKNGYLRASVVRDPLRRGNTGDNTPAVLHTRLVSGDRVRLTVMPKGFGSENMSRLHMFTPAASRADIVCYVAGAVERAGSNPCPPVVIGVGLGGTADMAVLLAKRALLRPVGQANADPFYAAMEREILESVNRLGIGPQGLGGSVTALGAAVEIYPTHIAGLPCAVNIGCHVTRHAEAVL